MQDSRQQTLISKPGVQQLNLRTDSHHMQYGIMTQQYLWSLSQIGCSDVILWWELKVRYSKQWSHLHFLGECFKGRRVLLKLNRLKAVERVQWDVGLRRLWGIGLNSWGNWVIYKDRQCEGILNISFFQWLLLKNLQVGG